MVKNTNDIHKGIKRRINMEMHVIIHLRKFYRPIYFPRNWKLIHIELLYYRFLYACETWSLTLREEHRLREFENKVLRKISGAKSQNYGRMEKVNYAELQVLYSLPYIIQNLKSRQLRWTGHIACMELSRNEYRVLVWKPEGKRPSGKPRHRWEDNIKMDLRGGFWSGRLDSSCWR